MDELVGFSVCLMHIYLPTVYYYSWENCTKYISFRCIVTTKMFFQFSVASENQNIYRKWSSIRHKQVINNINRSQEMEWTLFHFTLRIRTKALRIFDVKFRIVCCVHHKMYTNSDLVLQSNNLILCMKLGRFSHKIKLLEYRDAYKDYWNKIKCNKIQWFYNQTSLIWSCSWNIIRSIVLLC